MFCKDCLFFKQWKSVNTSMCEKFRKHVDTRERPCDEFISKIEMSNEWGERTDRLGRSCEEI